MYFTLFYSEEDEPRASFKNLSMGQIDGDIAGLRKKRSQFNPALANKGVGKWEQHTKGIGAKLLLQVRSSFISPLL